MQKIVPLYSTTEPNSSVSLGERQATIWIGSKAVTTNAHVQLRFRPTDRLIISTHIADFKYFNQLLKDDLKIRLDKQDKAIPILALQTQFKHPGVHIDAIPQKARIILCSDRRQKYKDIRFHIINFTPFLNTKDSSQNSAKQPLSLHQILLEDDEWEILIEAVENISELSKKLSADGGYAITHVGRLSRRDGKSFSATPTEKVFSRLALFLSFARGQWVSPFGMVATNDKSEPIYEEWSIRTLTPWASRLSWFDTNNGDCLAQLFPGFSKLLRYENNDNAISGAIYWYLRSNRGGEGAGVDSGVILSQAALERLSLSYLTRNQLSTRGSAADQILRTLKYLNIPTVVPKELRKLYRARRNKIWTSGPEAITRVRNELVHPNKRLNIKLGGYIYEVWNLSQMYIELMLLRMSDYNGVYSRRLTSRWVGEVDPVPWSKK